MDDEFEVGPFQETTIDLSRTPIVSDVQIGVGQLGSKTFECDCGRDHSNDKYVLFELLTDRGVLRFISFESSQFFGNFIKGTLDEAARACLAKLELRGLE